MSPRIREINFEGKEYVLIPLGEKDGAIATKEAYRNRFKSYAHLYPNGDILRFSEKIGTIEDVTFGNMVEIKHTEEAFKRVLGLKVELNERKRNIKKR